MNDGVDRSEITENPVEMECVTVTLEPENTLQCEDNDAFESSSVCDAVCDINAVQRQLLETKKNRDLGSQIPLPEGKDVHFFISYSSDDRLRVLPIVARLEQTHRVSCILDERDFISGMEIHENIRRSMEMSMKVLLFLSENFLQSGYCGHERNLAFVLSMREGRNIVIPVKMEECDVPSTLETLTYIDVSTDNLTDRIIEAYNSTDTDFLPTDLGAATKLENGYTIRLPCELEKTCFLRPRTSKILMDEKTKQLMSTGKFQVSEKTVQDAIDIVNSYKSSGHWSRSHRRVYCCLWCCTWPLVVLALLLVWGIIGLAVYDNRFSQMTEDVQTRYQTAFWIVSISGSIVICAGIAWHYERRKKVDKRRLRAELFRNVTLNTYDEGVVFKVCDYSSYISACRFPCLRYAQPDITIEIVRYDLKPCQKYLGRKIKQLVEEKSGNEQVITMDEYEDKADQIIRTALNTFMYGYVPDAPENRHNVKGGRSCFCQVLEPRVGNMLESWIDFAAAR